MLHSEMGEREDEVEKEEEKEYFVDVRPRFE